MSSVVNSNISGVSNLSQDTTTNSITGPYGSVLSTIPRYGASSCAISQRGVIGMFPDGAYLAYDDFPGAGEGSAQLARIVGDPLAGGVATRLTQTSSGATNNLANAAGTGIGSSSNSITQAWVTSNGDVWFVMVATGNFHYLYRAKASTYTVGSDASYSNKRACIDIGTLSGTQTANIRTFNQRAFLEATVNGATHLYFCEYNVASGRVDGGTNDQCLVYRSTDNGTTWSVFFTFNTNGTHQIDHFHGAVQDPYTGWIYFLTGDNGNECAIIGYNGTAAAVAANATLATIGATSGYKVIYGSELNRYTDLCFDQYTAFSIPDSDTEAADTTSTTFVSTRIPRMLDAVISVSPVTRFNDIPPCQKVQSSTYGTYMVSFRTQSANTTNEPYLYLWGANVEDGTWTLIAKIKNQRATTGIPKSLFIDNQGRLWIGATYKGGVSFDSSLSSSATTSSAIITLGSRTTTPSIFDGV